MYVKTKTLLLCVPRMLQRCNLTVQLRQNLGLGCGHNRTRSPPAGAAREPSPPTSWVRWPVPVTC